jgi:isocitrate lyase
VTELALNGRREADALARGWATEERWRGITRRSSAEVGAGYFGAVATVTSAGESSTLALTGSTEEAQLELDRNGDAAAARAS